MRLMIPKAAEPGLPLLFNVEGSVGRNGQNLHSDDILLVQFLLSKMADSAIAFSAERRAKLANVPLTGTCDAATIDGISAFQGQIADISPGTVVDGKVSVASGYEYGSGTYTIVQLNSALRTRFPQFWPRLFDVPGCPPALQAKVKTLM